MFTVGEFSQLAQVSKRLLRYYDEIGLLKPSHTDRSTGYRYYSAAQMTDLNRILALKEILRNPALYGFTVVPEELYENLPVKKVEVDSSIVDLADFAKEQGINYKILKIHNPWLRDRKLQNSAKKTYSIEIPLRGY